MTIPLPHKVGAIVFDLDGTLYDQRRLRLSMALLLFSECAKNPYSGLRAIRFLRAYRASLEVLRNRPEVADWAAEQIAMACKRVSVTCKDAIAIVEQYFEAAPLARLHRFQRPGMVEFLREAQARGIRLGVWSDYPAAAKLDALGVSRYFDAVVSAGDPEVNRLKPDPAGLNLCMARLGVRAGETVYVGDRIDVDAECARRAGVCSIIVGSRRVGGFQELSKMLL